VRYFAGTGNDLFCCRTFFVNQSSQWRRRWQMREKFGVGNREGVLKDCSPLRAVIRSAARELP
jgi:hypothetical protein